MSGFLFLGPLHYAERRSGRHLEALGLPQGLKAAEAHLLAYLSAYAPCPLAQVQRVFGHRRSTLTSLVDRFEEKGWVKRAMNPEDRRSFILSLTAEGRGVAERVHARMAEFEEEVLARTSDEEVHGFRAVLTAIAEVAAGPAGPAGMGGEP